MTDANVPSFTEGVPARKHRATRAASLANAVGQRYQEALSLAASMTYWGLNHDEGWLDGEFEAWQAADLAQTQVERALDHLVTALEDLLALRDGQAPEDPAELPKETA